MEREDGGRHTIQWEHGGKKPREAANVEDCLPSHLRAQFTQRESNLSSDCLTSLLLVCSSFRKFLIELVRD